MCYPVFSLLQCSFVSGARSTVHASATDACRMSIWNCLFSVSSWQAAGVQEALGKLLTTEHMSSSMKLLTLQGWSLIKFGGHIINFQDPRFLPRLQNDKLNFSQTIQEGVFFFLHSHNLSDLFSVNLNLFVTKGFFSYFLLLHDYSYQQHYRFFCWNGTFSWMGCWWQGIILIKILNLLLIIIISNCYV